VLGRQPVGECKVRGCARHEFVPDEQLSLDPDRERARRQSCQD
jgi:hypothetical protein